jgi:hypothetical protein
MGACRLTVERLRPAEPYPLDACARDGAKQE